MKLEENAEKKHEERKERKEREKGKRNEQMLKLAPLLSEQHFNEWSRLLVSISSHPTTEQFFFFFGYFIFLHINWQFSLEI